MGRSNASVMVDRAIEAGHGAKAAYVSREGSLSYEELMRQVNRMGHLLRELGVRREERVLLVLDNTTSFPIAFLGAMRIGAVPVPVSVLEAPGNLKHFIEDSYAQVVICDPEVLTSLQSVLADFDLRYLVRGGGEGAIDLDGALASQESELGPVATNPDDMAFWLYSSGSTGRPKGVVHVHKTIGVTCETYGRQVLGIKEDDRIFSTSKFYHAYGLGNSIASPLYFGATGVLLSGPPTPERLLEVLRELKPTVYFAVPALYAHLAGDPEAQGAMDSVRLCVSAAEALPLRIFAQWLERFELEIIDIVGSTEMLQSYCANRPGEVVPGTMGRPVPGYELRLMDELGVELEGPGVGAMEVKGESCAAYYWHQYERTKRTMRGEWFATGDRCERRVDGTYVYIGRVDDMLKVGGLWASPIDMEQVMVEHPAVAGVGVVGATIDGYSRVVAFVKCVEGVQGDDELSDALRSMCRERLREHEYPHLIRYVDELPQTLTGKPRRFKLREMLKRELASVPAGGGGGAGGSNGAATAASGDVGGGSAGGGRPSERSLESGPEGRLEAAPTPPSSRASSPATLQAVASVALASEPEDEPRMSSEELAGLGADERKAAVKELLALNMAEVLGRPVSELQATERTFKELGFDSLAAVELRNRLAQATGLRLPSTLTFDHPTPAGVEELLNEQLQAPQALSGNGAEAEQAASDLGPALEKIKQFSVAPPMPSASPGVRVKTSTGFHRMVPRKLAIERAERRGAAIWEESENDREMALMAMESVVGGTSRESELQEIAREHLIERTVDRAIFWQPWSSQIDEESAARVKEAFAQSRGVVFSLCHTGPYFCAEYASPFEGHLTYMVPGAWFFETPSSGNWGRRLARWRKGMKSLVVPADGSFPVVQGLLERGDRVFIYFDMPGPRETRFLGKPAMLAEGTAQAAVRADTLILSLRTRREGQEVWVDAAEPLDPRQFPGVDELHKALAAQHESWILERPAEMEGPHRMGWGRAATAQAWNQPE